MLQGEPQIYVTVDPAPYLILRKDPRVANLIPKVQELDAGYMAVPHGPTETRLLRNLGYPAPAPIHSQYDWPGPPPFKAQRATAALLSVEPRAYVLNEMGTGKTRSVLFAFDFLRQRGHAKRMVVCAPLSTLGFTWAREIMQVFPHLQFRIVHGPKAKRVAILDPADPADIYIINHDGLRVVEDELKALSIDVWVFDELAVFRNARAARSKVAQRLTADAPRVWGLTGTPTPKAPTDAFGQLRLVTPMTSPKSFRAFQSDTMLSVSQFRWVPKREAQETVFRLMQPAVRYRLTDCIDLPPIIYRDEEVTLGAEQQRVYKELSQKMRSLLWTSRDVVAANEGVLRGKLLQAAGGVIYDSDGNGTVLDGTARFDVLLDLLEQIDGKVLIFANWKALIRHVVARLDAEGHEFGMVTGDVGERDRTRLFSRLQDPSDSLRGIVAHPGAMAHGLTLTEANMVVWFTLTDNLELYLQANSRVYRPGQKKHVIITHLLGSPVEKLVARRLQNKKTTQGVLLELFDGA